jgi:CubicO group peptidase (beta-lactamase class C family)
MNQADSFPLSYPRAAHKADFRQPAFVRHACTTLLLLAAAGTSGCAGWRLDLTAQAATGFASQVLCDEVFITGTPPEVAFEERIRPLPGMNAVVWALGREVNTAQRELRVRLAGGFESVARHRLDIGCVTVPGGDADKLPAAPTGPATTPAPATPDPWGDAPMPASSAALHEVLASAVSAPADGTPPRSKALVVLHHGHLVGEAYATGVTPQTPLLAFSVSKSLTAALAGLLMQQGRLQWAQRASIAAWADPADPRHAITVEHLLRQTSGLDLPQNNSGADATTRIMYGGARDKAAAAASAPLAATPGTRWAYTDAHYMLLSQLLRDAVGGQPGGLQRFAQAKLWGPTGMRHVVMDTDASGTPMGSSHFLAPARSLARFGHHTHLVHRLRRRAVDQPPARQGAWLGRALGPARSTGRQLLCPRLHGPVCGGGALAPRGHRAHERLAALWGRHRGDRSNRGQGVAGAGGGLAEFTHRLTTRMRLGVASNDGTSTTACRGAQAANSEHLGIWANSSRRASLAMAVS